MHLRLVILAAWIALLAGAAGASNRHEAGRAIYNYRCYFCHGYSGDARTLADDPRVPGARVRREGGRAALTTCTTAARSAGASKGLAR